MNLFSNLDFGVRGTNTPPIPNMMANTLGSSEHILFTAHDYNTLTPFITKNIQKISNIYSHVKMEEVWDPNQILKLFQKSGLFEIYNIHNLLMVLFL